MSILVAVKRVVDSQALIRVKSDGSGLEMGQVKMAVNPFDEIAVEEAVRIKEKGETNEVVVVTIGSDACQETLRTTLAMGADRALLVKTDMDIQPLAAAKILKAIALQESPQLIILGKQAIDTDNNQVGQMLAALLQWPQGTFISQLDWKDSSVRVSREIDGGSETLELQLPAVVTTDLRLNEPRYRSLPHIMQAKRKPLTVIEAGSLQLDLQPRVRILNLAGYTKRRAGRRLASVAELVQQLKEEQVIG